MNIFVNDNYSGTFRTYNDSGEYANADQLPVLVLERNGTADHSVTVTVESTAAGLYRYAFTVPASYTIDDALSVSVAIVVGGQAINSAIALGSVEASVAMGSGLGNTARSLFKQALSMINVCAPDETPADADLELCLMVCKQMLDAWQLEPLLVPGRVTETFHSVASKSFYSLGDGGDFDTVTPISIERIQCIIGGGRAYTLRSDSLQEWNATVDSVGSPVSVYVEEDQPLFSLRFNCALPENCTLVVSSVKPLRQILSLDDDITFPPGVELAVVNNLAVDLASYFETQPSQVVTARAVTSKAQLKRSNKRRATLSMPAGLAGVGAYDIQSGP